jgi:hypothetical protein
MSQTNLTETAETTTAPKGFPGLRCIRCGVEDGCHLDLEDCDRVYCSNCEEDFSLKRDLRPAVAAWQRLLAWVATAPAAD